MVLVDEPFPFLRERVGILLGAVRGFRAEGRAVLLVDPASRAWPLVDRVLAMYLGEHVAEGTAEEVMQQ